MSKRAVEPWPSEHADWPGWGSAEWAPMQEPTRLTWLLNGGGKINQATAAVGAGAGESGTRPGADPASVTPAIGARQGVLFG